MSSETVIPYAPKQKSTASQTDMDRAGNAILEFLKHAGETTETELQEAREAAEYLADQLRAAKDRINDLEADSDAIRLGQIALRNGCVKFRRKSSTAPPVGLAFCGE